jgi:hypothetical protein
LRMFGEAGVVTIVGTIKKKVDMRGLLCLMGGYCTDRAGDCYKMYDPINNNVYYTRDVLWLNKMYFDKNGEVDSLPDISADLAPAAPVAQALTQVPDNQVGVCRTKAKKKSCLKAVSFPVPNGENDASVVPIEQQYAAFKTDNDIYIDLKLTMAATLKVKVMWMMSSILMRMSAVKKMKPLLVQSLMVLLDQVGPSRTCNPLISLLVPLNTEAVRMIIECARMHS